MAKECAVCKQPAVVVTHITQGQRSANVYLCETCCKKLSHKARLEIIHSISPNLPSGSILDNTIQSTETINSDVVADPNNSLKVNSVYTQRKSKMAKKNASSKKPVFVIFGILLSICVLVGGVFLIRHIFPHNVSWSAINPSEAFEPLVMFPHKPTIEETILYDQNNIRITAKKLNYTSLGAELLLQLENNTESDMVIFSNTSAYSCNSVNGYMVPCGTIDENVQANSSTEATALYSSDDLSFYSITDIADLEIGFGICDPDNNYIYTGPCPLQTSLVDTYDYSSVSYVKGITHPWVSHEYNISIIDILDNVLYDANNVRIEKGVILKNSENHLLISLEVQNNNDKPINFSVKDLALNEVIIRLGTWTSISINPRKINVIEIFLDNVVDECIANYVSSDNPETVDFVLKQYDADYNELVIPSSIHINLGGKKAKKGSEIYRDNRIVVYQLGVKENIDSYNTNYHIPLVFSNLTTEDIYIHISDEGVIINGIPDVDSFLWSFSLPGRSKALRDIVIDDDSFENAGISSWDEVENISLVIEPTGGNSVKLEFSTKIK